jgi:hypothetical protein
MSTERLELAWRTLGDRPSWYVLVGLGAWVVISGFGRGVHRGRRAEALALVTAGVIGAGAALPDTEVVVLVGLGLAAATLVALGAGLLDGPALPVPIWTGATVVAGGLVAWALLDGARGRPGCILIAPAVVAPMVVVRLWPGRGGLLALGLRTTVTLLVVVLVARHAGLGDGTLRPALGGLAGAVLLGVVQRGADGRRAGPSPTSG